MNYLQMKKLLGIVVLGLLVCNITFAKTIIGKKLFIQQLKKVNEKTFRDRGSGFEI